MNRELVRDLEPGLERGEVVPFFQPIVHLRTGQLHGFEVLSRWRHPSRGLLLPDSFIHLAENLGLIGLLTEKVLCSAFIAMAKVEDVRLAVNISPLQLRDRSLPKQISRLAASAGFPLNRLTMEVTETALVDNVELALAITRECKDLGVKLSLDDFGTGYSSLKHLQALPFDELKVDRSFVSAMTTRRECRKIVAAVVGLGRSLGMKTIAEGVEETAQAEMLTWLGCDLAQGWLYGRAVPQEEAIALAGRLSLTPVFFERQTPADTTLFLESLSQHRFSQLQAIYDGAPVGLCFLDCNLRHLSVNRQMAEMNRLSMDSHVGRTVEEVVPPFVYAELKPYMMRALAGETVTGLEVVVSAPDAESKTTMMVSYNPARDEAGEVVGISVVVMDITKLKRGEEALRLSEDHYRHLIELNPQIPWTMSTTGEITDVSSKWGDLTGISKEASLGLGWLSLLHPNDVRPTMSTVGECLQTGNPIDVEYRVRRFDGEWRWMRARGFPCYDENGRITNWYGSVEDIEQQKRTETELHQSRQLLRGLFHDTEVR